MQIFNFSPGPAILPQEVFEAAASGVRNLDHSGLSVLEISHRSKAFSAILEEAEALVRELHPVTDDYAVLFLTGGASTQFFMAPMNLLNPNETAAYLDTGSWSAKAIKEAKHFGKVHVLASSKDSNYNYIPKGYTIPADVKYVHITTNNTIFGTQLHELPETDAPLVADSSSDILSRNLPLDRFGIIYAGAQKNLGPAGVTVVIVRKDLLGKVDRALPSMLDYRKHIEKSSTFNTPPVFPIYALLLNLRWLKAQGGVAALQARNEEKAQLLYQEIDRNALFKGTVTDPADRSRMNVTFFTNDDAHLQPFLETAEAAGCRNLKGHRSVGGLRASIYNALPKAGVEQLIEVMQQFEQTHAKAGELV